MATMYLMSGPSAAGKTTFAKNMLVSNPTMRYLGIDDFYEMFHGTVHNHSHEFQVWMSFFEAINVAVEDGVDVVIDTNSPTVVMRSQFLDWFGKFDRYELIFINASLKDCREMNAKRARTVPESELLRMYHQVEHPSILEDSRWDAISCYLRTGQVFGSYETPLAGRGDFVLSNCVTETVSNYIAAEYSDAVVSIVVPARGTDILYDEESVHVPIYAGKKRCAYMWFDLMTGLVDSIMIDKDHIDMFADPYHTGLALYDEVTSKQEEWMRDESMNDLRLRLREGSSIYGTADR